MASSKRHRPFSFKAFLSHRYKSPEVNLYFFDLFSEIAEVQFEVDEGTFSTNVTRLERMIRDSDAFIGIYPFPGSWEESQSIEGLRKASRYFRLELDLAIRSRKPGIIFYDERYRDLLQCPGNILARAFDSYEVTGSGGSPRAGSYKDAFKRFCGIVQARMAYDVAKDVGAKTGVCIGLPEPGLGYNMEHREAIRSVLKENGHENFKELPWPPVLNRDAFVLLQEIDWVLIDIGADMAATGIPAYLHGQFVPTLRLEKDRRTGEALSSPMARSLFGGVEVGYVKDILRWEDTDSLREGLKARLSSLRAGAKRINTADEARAYFIGAALRKEAVFLSYSGRDQDSAMNLAAALKKRFQKVFDYRNPDSIRPGERWIETIFDQLSASAVGVPLLSSEYFSSGNCMHELEQMVALQDNRKMKLIPVKLYKEPLALPSLLQSTQYLRLSDYNSPEAAATAILGFLQ
jgi:hypothetical protein